MKRFFQTFLTTIILAVVFSTTMQAKGKSEKAVYAFTYGTCFNDSTVYLSTIERIQDASIDSKTNFLVDRNSYANALKKYLDKKYKKPHTCTIFYASKRDKVEKKYVKIRHHVNKDKNTKLVEIPVTDFKLLPLGSEQ